MSTTIFYDKLIENLNRDSAEKKRILQAIYHTLKNHVGKKNAIALPELATQVFGKDTETTRRETREAIETLRNQPYDIPVCSNSGKAGRYLPATLEELYECSGELVSRGTKSIETGRNLDRVAKSWFAREIAKREYVHVEAVQAELFELPKVYA